MKAKLAKRKTGFCMRMKESWKEMKLWDAEELNKLDWVISALILIFLFFTCAYGDLMLTGNRSFLMYEHFTDFYKASYEQSHGYYANYLPSTFLAYAIWNLPLYLTGHAPQAMLTNSFINNMWYKLLPVWKQGSEKRKQSFVSLHFWYFRSGCSASLYSASMISLPYFSWYWACIFM